MTIGYPTLVQSSEETCFDQARIPSRLAGGMRRQRDVSSGPRTRGDNRAGFNIRVSLYQAHARPSPHSILGRDTAEADHGIDNCCKRHEYQYRHPAIVDAMRSEEHTSELQSRQYLV